MNISGLFSFRKNNLFEINNNEKTLYFIFGLTLSIITFILSINQMIGYSFLGKIISALVIFVVTHVFIHYRRSIWLFIFPTLIFATTIFSGPWKIGTYKVVSPAFEGLYSSWNILLGLFIGSIVSFILFRNNQILEKYKINVSFLAYIM